ncbi:MAG: outer membrane beta-barrel protein [Bacteroides sp.]|nr:outer membrane beta-barrel protein [Bacteroides sp.]
MKKVVLGMMLMMLVVASATAQVNEKKNHWGVRANAEVTFEGSDTKTYWAEKVWGFNVSAFYQYFLGEKGWYLEPQASFYYMGYDASDEWVGVSDSDAHKMKEYGLGVALAGGYTFSLSEKCNLQLFTGPDFKYAFSCRNEADLTDWYFNPALLRWKVGAGVNLGNWEVTLSALMDVTKKSKESFYASDRNVALSFGIGYHF